MGWRGELVKQKEDSMTLQERREKLVNQLMQAEKQLEQAENNVQQLIGAIKLVDLMTAEEQSNEANNGDPDPNAGTDDAGTGTTDE